MAIEFGKLPKPAELEDIPQEVWAGLTAAEQAQLIAEEVAARTAWIAGGTELVYGRVVGEIKTRASELFVENSTVGTVLERRFSQVSPDTQFAYETLRDILGSALGINSTLAGAYVNQWAQGIFDAEGRWPTVEDAFQDQSFIEGAEQMPTRLAGLPEYFQVREDDGSMSYWTNGPAGLSEMELQVRGDLGNLLRVAARESDSTAAMAERLPDLPIPGQASELPESTITEAPHPGAYDEIGVGGRHEEEEPYFVPPPPPPPEDADQRLRWQGHLPHPEEPEVPEPTITEPAETIPTRDMPSLLGGRTVARPEDPEEQPHVRMGMPHPGLYYEQGPGGMPVFDRAWLDMWLKALEPPGRGSGRGTITFDKDEVVEYVNAIWRDLYQSDAPRADQMADRYITEATQFYASGGSLDLEAWTMGQVRQDPKYGTYFSRKPTHQSEAEYAATYRGVAGQFGFRPSTETGQIRSGMQSGVGAEAFGSRLMGTREARTARAGDISQSLAGLLGSLGRVARS